MKQNDVETMWSVIYPSNYAEYVIFLGVLKSLTKLAGNKAGIIIILVYLY